MKIYEALDFAAKRLSSAGVDSAAWDAEALLRHVLLTDRAGLMARQRETLDSDVGSRYFELVAARSERRPLQHLTGKQYFWRHDFLVTPDALIPRPETELAVQAALDLLHDVGGPRIFDVGTGSGCIALSLACERSDARIHASDISSVALGVALRNARRLGCVNRVLFHQGDLFEPLAGLGIGFDLIVSNPPYVDPSEIDSLAPEVRNHDPRVALVAPNDRFSVYRRLVPDARRFLKNDGWLVLEIGDGMEQGVREICSSAGYAIQRSLTDPRGRTRVVLARYSRAN